MDARVTANMTWEQVRAYEDVLCALLDIRTPEELRDIFSREIAQDSAQLFADALSRTRARGQPDSFALAWAMEDVIAERSGRGGIDFDQMFNDPAYHTPPSRDVENMFDELWERRR